MPPLQPIGGPLQRIARTFATKRDADRWLAKTEVEILSDQWLDPDAGAVEFGCYAEAWISERPELRPKTVELYRYVLQRHLRPAFGGMALADIREPQIRRWRKERIDSGISEVTLAKAYRLLRAIMTTAVDDGAVRRSPCRIKGAGQERSPERPLLTIPQVFALADAIDERYRALVLLGAFGSLRWGELAALRQLDIDLEAGSVRVERTLVELQNSGLSFGPPKSEAGKRSVAFPPLVMPDLRWHLACFAQPGPDGIVFVGPEGGLLRRGNFRRRVWLPALKAAGLPDVHFHDLRHVGNQLTANAGANLRELMTRMGHSSTRAAMIYLHSTRLYRPGIGPFGEDDAVAMTLTEMQAVHRDAYASAGKRRYPSSRHVCDLALGSLPDWAIEVKLARLGRDNGTYEDAAIKKILSPYPDDRSAVTDCWKLANSGFAGKQAILIYGFEDPDRPLSWLIDAFEAIAARTAKLGQRYGAPLRDLVHPVFTAGHVYAWQVLTAEVTATPPHIEPMRPAMAPKAGSPLTPTPRPG